jgi:hypothetical protein
MEKTFLSEKKKNENLFITLESEDDAGKNYSNYQ